MKLRILFSISLLSALPVWSQVNGTTPNAENEAVNNRDDAQMLTPPPVSGEAYAMMPQSVEHSNYLLAGMRFNTTYVLGSVTSKPVTDVAYSVSPTIELDHTTPRWKSTLNYAPGFTFFQGTTGQDQADQNASMNVQYRVTEHVTASVRDSFEKTSNVFSQPDLLSLGGVYGSLQPPTIAVIAPIGDRLMNTANAELTYQFSANSMVGGRGTFVNLQYPNQGEVPGLYDSTTSGGSAFYSHRVSKRQYLGAQFQYSRILAFPAGAPFEVQTQTPVLFYTVYLKPTLSLSFAGGPQHYQATETLPGSRPWSPAASASLGWKGRRTTFAASYGRTITGGGGLTGAFDSNNASVFARWQIERTWSIGVTGYYSIYKNLTPVLSPINLGGHMIFGTASLRHAFGQYFDAELGYARIHESYSDVAVATAFPDTNCEYITISYHFIRPLGR